MRFALVNGERQEPQPKLKGECPCCGKPMIARCGPVRVWHWAHKAGSQCDPWWENESEWHRGWKALFPLDWQEVVHHAEDGERHIADVKTAAGCVLEFQYSYIKRDEVRSREAFYRRLEWVVHGGRRSGDYMSLPGHWRNYKAATTDPPVMRVRIEGNPLLRDWVGSAAQVYFDFSKNREVNDGDDFWCLMPENDDEWAYVAPYPREKFIERHRHPTRSSIADHDALIAILAAGIEEQKRLPPLSEGIRPAKSSQERTGTFVAEQNVAKTAEQIARGNRIYAKALEGVPRLDREYPTDHPYGFSQDRMEDFLAKDKALRLAKEEIERLDKEDENGS
jgi:competence protein CoiA